MNIRIERGFDASACNDCDMAETCAAGKLVNTAMDAMWDEASSVFDRQRDDYLNTLLDSGDLAGYHRDFSEATTRAKKRYDQVRRGLGTMFAASVNAQNKWGSELSGEYMGGNLRDDMLKDAVDEFEASPFPLHTLPEDITVDYLQLAADNIIHYDRIGECQAVDLRQIG